MTSLSRAYLAVYPPEVVADALEERLRVMEPIDGLRVMARDQWHVTLRFCGRVPDPDALLVSLTRALARVAPVDGVCLGGAGAFPKPRHGSALWVGVGDEIAVGSLGRVAAATEAACVAIGLAPDDRRFLPHVTVARCARARDLRSAVAALGGAPIGPAWTVGEVRLMASDTRSTGAVHTEVARIPL